MEINRKVTSKTTKSVGTYFIEAEAHLLAILAPMRLVNYFRCHIGEALNQLEVVANNGLVDYSKYFDDLMTVQAWQTYELQEHIVYQAVHNIYRISNAALENMGAHFRLLIPYEKVISADFD